MKGIEPLTYALRERRSTPELHRRGWTVTGHYRKSGVLVKLVLPALLLLACSPPRAQNPQPGVFHVPVFDGDDVFALDGLWILEPSSGPPLLVQVPGYWNNQHPLPARATATYRARLTFPVSGLRLGLHVGEIQTAYRIWLDGEPLGGRGDPDTFSEEGVDIGHSLYRFTSQREMDLRIEVGNRFNPIGGIGDSLLIGPVTAVVWPRLWNKVAFLVQDGIQVFLLLYVLIFAIFGFRKPLFLSLAGLILFTLIRDNLLNQRLLILFLPNLSSALLTRWEYVTILGISVCFVAYLWQLSQGPNFHRFFYVITAVSALYLAFLIALPFEAFLSFFRGYIVLAAVILVWMLYLFIRRKILPRTFGIPFVASFIPLFLGAGHDLIQGFFMFGNLYLLSPAMTAYLLFQVGILHRKQQETIANILGMQKEKQELQTLRSGLLVAFLPKFRSKLQDALKTVDTLPPDRRKTLLHFGLQRLEYVFHVFDRCFHGNREIDWVEIERMVKTLPEPDHQVETGDWHQNLKILIVDDESLNRLLIRSVLGRKGISVIEAEDGRKGLEAADAERPDLILMDIMMPVLNGYDTVLEMKKRLGEMPPFCFLTAKSDHSDIVQSLRLGACGFQTKPFSIQSFYPRMNDYLLLCRHPEPKANETPVTLQLRLHSATRELDEEDEERIESCLAGSFPNFRYLPGERIVNLQLPPTRLIHLMLRFLLILDGVGVSLVATDRSSARVPRGMRPGLVLHRASLSLQIPQLAPSVFLEEIETDLLFFSWHSHRNRS